MHDFKSLAGLFEERFSKTLPFPDQPQTLYDPCRYFLQLGGKRIRPVLCLMANELFGEINEDAWHAAQGIELFHNFTLIHDDIMDRAPLRRGQATIHDKYGLVAGILCGDIMSIYAYEQLAKIKRSLPQILHLFNTTSIQVSEGQQLDMDFEKRDDVHIDEYVHMITLKTSVLLACALKMGALLGGSTEGNANKLYQFGKNVGISFQLQDDYLDAFGSSDKTGKQSGGDIKDNKKTYLLIKALENADDKQKAEIKSLLASDNDDKIEKMLGLYKATCADFACQDAVKKYSQSAFNYLDEAAVTSQRKKPLYDLAAYLLMRDK
jgi:geranylgeranyl diphosphate synthase type II